MAIFALGSQRFESDEFRSVGRGFGLVALNAGDVLVTSREREVCCLVIESGDQEGLFIMTRVAGNTGKLVLMRAVRLVAARTCHIKSNEANVACVLRSEAEVAEDARARVTGLAGHCGVRTKQRKLRRSVIEAHFCPDLRCMTVVASRYPESIGKLASMFTVACMAGLAVDAVKSKLGPHMASFGIFVAGDAGRRKVGAGQLKPGKLVVLIDVEVRWLPSVLRMTRIALGSFR